MGQSMDSEALYLSMSSRSTYSPVRVNTTDSFFFAGNPLICGFRPLELILNAEKACIGLPNFHQSVYLVSVLYNACLYLGLSSEK